MGGWGVEREKVRDVVGRRTLDGVVPPLGSEVLASRIAGSDG